MLNMADLTLDQLRTAEKTYAAATKQSQRVLAKIRKELKQRKKHTS